MIFFYLFKKSCLYYIPSENDCVIKRPNTKMNDDECDEDECDKGPDSKHRRLIKQINFIYIMKKRLQIMIFFVFLTNSWLYFISSEDECDKGPPPPPHFPKYGVMAVVMALIGAWDLITCYWLFIIAISCLLHWSFAVCYHPARGKLSNGFRVGGGNC